MDKSKWVISMVTFLFLWNCQPYTGVLSFEEETLFPPDVNNDDSVEELNAEEEDRFGNAEGIGLKPVEISIQPVTPDEFSCDGLPDGNQVDPSPKDCLSFYLCINETAYKIQCPKIPDQTFYNPVSRACGFFDEHFCKEFLGIPPPERGSDEGDDHHDDDHHQNQPLQESERVEL